MKGSLAAVIMFEEDKEKAEKARRQIDISLL